MKKILKTLFACLLVLGTLPMQAQNDCDFVVTCIDVDGNLTDLDPCDDTIDIFELECVELLIDGISILDIDSLPDFDDYDFDDDYDYDYDFDCDFIVTCIDADGISTDYDACDETIDFNALECVEILIDGQAIPDFDDYYGYDFDDDYDYDFDECDIEFECTDLYGNVILVNVCDTTVDWNTIECDFEFDWDYYGYDDCDSLDLDDFDFDYYGYDFDFIITCIDADGIATDYDALDETIDWENLECVEILIDGIPINDFDDYYGYDYDDDYGYDFDDCDYEFECVDVDGNVTLVNICDTTVDWNTLDCNFVFDDFDFDYDDDYYDYDFDECDFVITCIDVDGISTDYDPCDETVDFLTLECTEILIDGQPIQDFNDFDFDDYYGYGYDYDYDFEFVDDSLWIDWECDTLFSIIIDDGTGNDPIIINPCDEESLIDLIENFDCIFDETIDCPWDTTGLYVWGDDGREFMPMSSASIVGFEELENNVSVNTIFPNPTIADFNINITVKEPSQINVKVFDITGQQVSSKLFDVGFGANSLAMNVDNVPNGIYQVYLFDETKMISNHKLSIVK